MEMGEKQEDSMDFLRREVEIQILKVNGAGGYFGLDDKKPIVTLRIDPRLAKSTV